MLKIGQFAVLTGIPASSLRYYDKIDLLKPAITDESNGYRYYAYNQLNQASRLVALRDSGFSLEELQKLLANQLTPGHVRALLRERRDAIQERIRDDEQRLQMIGNMLHEVEMDGRFSQYGVSLKSLPAQLVLSHRFYATSKDEIDDLVDSARAMLEKQAKASAPVRFIFYDLIYPQHRIEIEVAMPVAKRVTPNPPATMRELPAYPLVASVFQNGREGITRAWTDLRAWITGNGYQITGPFQELVLMDSPDGIVFELLFPIEKQATGDTS